VIIECRDDARVHLASSATSSRGARRLGRAQDEQALIGSLHALPVSPGDSVLVPAGRRTPWAPASSCSSCRSRPTSPCSWSGRASSSTDARTATSPGLRRGAQLRRPVGLRRRAAARAAGCPRSGRMLGAGTERLFRPRASATSVRAPPPEPGRRAARLVRDRGGARGRGRALDAGGTLELRAGMTVLVPHAGARPSAGELERSAAAAAPRGSA